MRVLPRGECSPWRRGFTLEERVALEERVLPGGEGSPWRRGFTREERFTLEERVALEERVIPGGEVALGKRVALEEMPTGYLPEIDRQSV